MRFLRSFLLLLVLLSPLPLICNGGANSIDLAQPAKNSYHDGVSAGETWFMAIPLGGPTYQLSGLKEVLALGRLLNRTVILPYIYEHYTPTRANNASRHLGYHGRKSSFDQIYDRTALTRFTKVVAQDELQAGGWDGRVDAVMWWSRSDLQVHMPRLMAHNVNLKQAVSIPMNLSLTTNTCLEPGAPRLSPLLARHRVVAVMTYRYLVDWRRMHEPVLQLNLCAQLYQQATAHMRKSIIIQNIAQEFIALSFSNRPFVALHVRPFPDRCLASWHTRHHLDPKVGTGCSNPSLHKQIVNDTARALQMVDDVLQSMLMMNDVDKAPRDTRPNPKEVFIFCHPQARSVIDSAFEGTGVRLVYLPADFLIQTLNVGSKVPVHQISMTSLLMVQEEIAAHSAVFVGTRESSISGTISQERLSSGVPATQTLWFGHQTQLRRYQSVRPRPQDLE